ncbi:RNA polymerase II mediator complex subunit [Gonapodya sp. JEL0774]|nr:RNA polymerase II mediator complex subunit [Gonapodya sp. JEL0774]
MAQGGGFPYGLAHPRPAPQSQLDQLLRAYPGTTGAGRPSRPDPLPPKHQPQSALVPPIPVKRYELTPPATRWLLRDSDRKDVAYADFYGQRPAQVEDLLTENTIRQGLVDRPFLQNETLSAYDLVVDRVKSEAGLANMTAFAGEVIRLKAEQRLFSRESTFRPPQRVHLNDAGREQWIRDLKETRVPLSQMAKNVPHGYKGEKLLDLVVEHRIPFVRATWFVKIVGACESVRRLVFPSYRAQSAVDLKVDHLMYLQAAQSAKDKDTYMSEWTRTVELHLQKYLVDLGAASPAPPTTSGTLNKASQNLATSGTSAVTSGMGDSHIRKQFAQSPETRAEFLARWTYSTNLARWHFVENLIDQKEFLQWMVRQVRSATFDQTFLLISLVSEYVDDMAKSRGLMRAFVEIGLGRMERLRNSASASGGILNADELVAAQYLAWIRLMQRCILAAPDAAVCPRWWVTCEKVVENILLDAEAPDTTPATEVATATAVLRAVYRRIRSRNAAFQPPQDLQRTPSEIAIPLLDKFTSNGDIGALVNELFPTPRDAGTDRCTIQRMLQWGVTRRRFGVHRPYLVASILQRYSRRFGDLTSGYDDLQGIVMAFLEEFEPADESEWKGVADVVGQLIQQQLFSWQGYSQWLIVRGCFQGERQENESDESQFGQRAALLDNSRNRVDFGTFLDCQRRIEQRMYTVFAQISPEPSTLPTVQAQIGVEQHVFKADVDLLESLQRLERFWQLEVSRWLQERSQRPFVGNVRDVPTSQTENLSTESCMLSATQLCELLRIYEACSDFEAILDLCLCIVTNGKIVLPNVDSVVADTIISHRLVFVSMDRIVEVWSAMLTKLQERGGDLITAEPAFIQCLLELSRVPVCGETKQYGDLNSILKFLSPVQSELLMPIIDISTSLELEYDQVKWNKLDSVQQFSRTFSRKHKYSVSAHNELLQLIGVRLAEEAKSVRSGWIGSGVMSADKLQSYQSIAFMTSIVARRVVNLEKLVQRYILTVLHKLMEELQSPYPTRKDLASLYVNVLRLLRVLLIGDGESDFLNSLGAARLNARKALDGDFGSVLLKSILAVLRELVLVEGTLAERNVASPPASPSPFPTDLLEAVHLFRRDLVEQDWFRSAIALHLETSYSVLVTTVLDWFGGPQVGCLTPRPRIAKVMSIVEDILLAPYRFPGETRPSFFGTLLSRNDTAMSHNTALRPQSGTDVGYSECFRWLVFHIDEWNLDASRITLKMLLDSFSALMAELTGSGSEALLDPTLMQLDVVTAGGPLGVLSPAATVKDTSESGEDQPLSAFSDILVREGLLAGNVTLRIFALLVEEMEQPIIVSIFGLCLSFLRDVPGGASKIAVVENVSQSSEPLLGTISVCLGALDRNSSGAATERFDLLEQLRQQLSWFVQHSREFEVMISCGLSFAASERLVQSSNDSMTYYQDFDLSVLTFGLTLRLQILASIVGVGPTDPELFKLEEWLRLLFSLLDVGGARMLLALPIVGQYDAETNPIIEAILDLLAFFLDLSTEASKDVKVSVNALLKEVSTSPFKDPQIMARIAVILPFSPSVMLHPIRGAPLLEDGGGDAQFSSIPLGLFNATVSDELAQKRILAI